MSADGRHRWRDFALYVAISFAVVGAVVVCALFLPHGSHTDFKRWVGLGAYTLFIFWYGSERSRANFRKLGYWAGVGMAFTVHTAIWISLLLHVTEWHVIWFNVMLVEYFPILFVLHLFEAKVEG